MPRRDKKISNGIQGAITNGINFLAKEQEKDGSFFCLDSFYPNNYKQAFQAPAIVPTNIVLSSLAHIANKKVERIKQKAAKFLLGEKGEYWSFNYWFRKSDWYKKEPYPDDTDDTFCVLAALYEYDPKLFDGTVMARIVTMLTSAEEKEGGPYDMWLVPPKARKTWHRIDLVCNSNIAYFLSLQNISLPKLTAFIEKSIDKKDYEFPYITPYPGIYFISRFYPPSSRLGGTMDGQAMAPEEKVKRIKEMVDLLLKKQEADGKWENPLRTALAVSSLINLEGFRYAQQFKRGVAYLIKTQKQNGGWDPYSFFFHMKTRKKTLYAGSPFITTALCLEAINKFQKSEARNSKSETVRQAHRKQIPNSKKEDEIYDKVLKNYRQRFEGFSEDFREAAIEFANKIAEKNKDIILLPYYFANSLHQNLKFNPPVGGHNSDLLIRLGEANLCGWIAYTIYDDFLDEEGDPKQLSMANVCLRESAEIFSNVLPLAKGFQAFSKKIFDTIDDANHWEITNCRLKFFVPRSSIKHSNILQNVRMFYEQAMPNFDDYTQLANKSLGHALGPIAILFALAAPQTHADSTRTSAEKKKLDADIKNLMRFFRNYIVARQLNDDAHDWEDDLKKGQVNAVGAMLLKDVKGNMSDPKKLREIFWHKTILGACKDILRHVEFAKKDLKKLSLIKEPTVFIEMLAAIERSADKALKEREEMMKFFKTYNRVSE